MPPPASSRRRSTATPRPSRDGRARREAVFALRRLSTTRGAERHGLAQGPAQPHRRHQGDAEDHQGHADGRGVEAAPRAGGGRGGAALCRATWTRCSATSRPRSPASTSAPRLLRGTGSDNVHLLVVCTAERGLCGPFNSAIVRLARERANALMGEGKEVKILCVGRKGYDQLAPAYEQQIVELVDLRARAHAALRECARRSPRRSSRCSTRASSTSARCSSRASGR